MFLIVQIDIDADVNARDNDDKMTLLHVAANNGHDSVVALLLGNGSDPNLKDEDENTPYDMTIDDEIL